MTDWTEYLFQCHGCGHVSRISREALAEQMANGGSDEAGAVDEFHEVGECGPCIAGDPAEDGEHVVFDVTVDGADPISLREFVTLNSPDGWALADPDLLAVARLAPGEAVVIGGGAAAEFVVRRGGAS